MLKRVLITDELFLNIDSIWVAWGQFRNTCRHFEIVWFVYAETNTDTTRYLYSKIIVIGLLLFRIYVRLFRMVEFFESYVSDSFKNFSRFMEDELFAWSGNRLFSVCRLFYVSNMAKRSLFSALIEVMRD